MMRLDLWLVPRFAVLGALAAGGGLGIACTAGGGGDGSSFVEHCGSANGNTTCALAYPERPYCSLCVVVADHEGCVAAPPAPACDPDHLGETGQSDEGTTGGGSDSTGIVDTTMGAIDSSGGATTSGSTGAVDEPCDDAEGDLDEDCVAFDPAQPYCVGGVCTSCTDAGGDGFCGAGDPALPFCDAAGTCEACSAGGDAFCGGATPVCSAAGACVACTEHVECPESACHLAVDDPLQGSCFGTDEVVWVDNGAICPGIGTEAQPFCSLSQTLATVRGSAVVRLAGGGATYAEQAVVTSATIALLGQDGPELSGAPAMNAASLNVQSGIVYVRGVRVSNNALSHGASCGGSTLWFDDSELLGNDGYGIYTLSACTTVVRRSSISTNTGGGIRALGGSVRLDNAAVGVNGAGNGGPAVLLQLADAEIVYSTLAGNDAAGADSLQCVDAQGTVRNSVITGISAPSVDLDCFTLDYSHNAIDTAQFAADGVAIGAYVGGWFVSPTLGDFRLIAPNNTPLGGVAQWQGGDAPFDADGTARPMAMPGYAGVDEP
jgi:hypothetical protein